VSKCALAALRRGSSRGLLVLDRELALPILGQSHHRFVIRLITPPSLGRRRPGGDCSSVCREFDPCRSMRGDPAGKAQDAVAQHRRCGSRRALLVLACRSGPAVRSDVHRRCARCRQPPRYPRRDLNPHNARKLLAPIAAQQYGKRGDAPVTLPRCRPARAPQKRLDSLPRCAETAS
jgi:hypothetical protein